VAKIVVIRVDAIGDALVATPLLAALRENGHEIGIVLSNANAGIFDERALSWYHVLDRIPWPKHGSTEASYARALAEMQGVRYDVALIASEEPEAYTLAREAAIPARVGFHNGWQKPIKSLWVASRCTRTIYRPAWASRAREHEVETLYKLGKNFVASPSPPRDRALLAPLLLAAAPERDATVVVQVTPKWRASGVSDEALVTALRALASRRDLRAVAAHSEKDYATAIAVQASVELEIFTALEPWKLAVGRAAMIVTPDTGSAHLAGMLGTPCVDCFPENDFALRERRWSPWAAPYVSLAFSPRASADAIASRLVDATNEVVRIAA
jgi:ADP-heptose:LPS heptosyltransferase